jgi:hypothetical protein
MKNRVLKLIGMGIEKEWESMDYEKRKWSYFLSTGIFLMLVYIFFFCDMAVAAQSPASNVLKQIKEDVLHNAFLVWLPTAQSFTFYLCGFTGIIGFIWSLKDVALSGNLTLDSLLAVVVRYFLIAGILFWLLKNSDGAPRLVVFSDSVADLGGAITHRAPVTLENFIGVQEEIMDVLYSYVQNLGWLDFGKVMVMTIIILIMNILLFMISATILVINIEVTIILVCGLITASLVFIPVFKDIFFGYIKGLCTAALKLSMMTIMIAIMFQILLGWVDIIKDARDQTFGIVNMSAAMIAGLVVMYMILNHIPSFAAAVMTGQPTGMGTGAFTGAAAAGFGAAAGAVSTIGGGVKNIANKTVDAARAYTAAKSAMQGTSDGGANGKSTKAAAGAAMMVMMGINGSGGAEAAGRSIQNKANIATGGRSANKNNSMSDPATRGETPTNV